MVCVIFDAYVSIVRHLLILGHAGAETAEYASAALPNVVREHVAHACSADPFVAEDITARLGQAIHAFDASLVNDLRDALPEDVEGMDDAELRSIINDQAAGGRTYAKVVRCMRGCTALVALVDPSGRNCWVANLGDGQAGKVRSDFTVDRLFTSHFLHIVFAERSASGMRTSFPSSPHNGSNPSEAQRVRNEHPGEPHALLNGRVLGVLTTTRGSSSPAHLTFTFVPDCHF